MTVSSSVRRAGIVSAGVLAVVLGGAGAAQASLPVPSPTVSVPVPTPTLPVPTLPVPTLPVPTLPVPTLPAPTPPAPTLPAPTLPSPPATTPPRTTPPTVPAPPTTAPVTNPPVPPGGGGGGGGGGTGGGGQPPPVGGSAGGTPPIVVASGGVPLPAMTAGPGSPTSAFGFTGVVNLGTSATPMSYVFTAAPAGVAPLLSPGGSGTQHAYLAANSNPAAPRLAALPDFGTGGGQLPVLVVLLATVSVGALAAGHVALAQHRGRHG